MGDSGSVTTVTGRRGQYIAARDGEMKGRARKTRNGEGKGMEGNKRGREGKGREGKEREGKGKQRGHTFFTLLAQSSSLLRLLLRVRRSSFLDQVRSSCLGFGCLWERWLAGVVRRL